jgi:ABC-type polysaccharide/polyol phosphate transport system ATPase subunit
VVPPIIEFRGVSKTYPIYDSASARLKELACLNRIRCHRDFGALRDVTFEVSPGETFCIVGENGSGKSTLLQIIAGILQPTNGEVLVRGRVAALLELGSGFNPEFTGRDNVYLSAAILGLSRQEIDKTLPKIEEFAEIDEFIDQPVKTYSTGMAVRLAFAVAIHVSPEILLVDEALSVGDLYFRQRCMRKVHEMRANGIAIVFVSHSIGDVQLIGDRAMWLDRGQVREIGATEEVVNKYMAAMVQKDNAYLTVHHSGRQIAQDVAPETPAVVDSIPNIDHRFGDGRAQVIGIALINSGGEAVHLLEPQSRIVVRISVRASENIVSPIVGFLMRNHMGLDFAGTNTAREGFECPPMRAGDVYTLDFHLQLPEFYPSSFSFSPAIADGTLDSNSVCDWIDNAIVLQMSPAEGQVYGYVRVPCRVELNRPLGTPLAVLSHAESEVG